MRRRTRVDNRFDAIRRAFMTALRSGINDLGRVGRAVLKQALSDRRLAIVGGGALVFPRVEAGRYPLDGVLYDERSGSGAPRDRLVRERVGVLGAPCRLGAAPG